MLFHCIFFRKDGFQNFKGDGQNDSCTTNNQDGTIRTEGIRIWLEKLQYQCWGWITPCQNSMQIPETVSWNSRRLSVNRRRGLRSCRAISAKRRRVRITDGRQSCKSRSLRLGKSVMDTGFGTFLQLLQYKTDRKAGYILYVEKWCPFSKTCH